MGLKQDYSQEELNDEVRAMILLLTEPNGSEKLEARILGKGRLEMQHLLAYLLSKYITAAIKVKSLQGLVDEYERQMNNVGREEAVPDSMES